MAYDLTKGHEPGYYTVGEGFLLAAKGNELTETQAAPYLEKGILEPAKRRAKAKKKG